MIRWTSLVFLISCWGGSTGKESPEKRVTGFWSLKGPATAAHPAPRTLRDFDLGGELRVDGPCTVAADSGGDTSACIGEMKAWYRWMRPGPTNLPLCDAVHLRLPRDSDSVILILSPFSDHSRRELRGVLQGDRIVGEWSGVFNPTLRAS